MTAPDRSPPPTRGVALELDRPRRLRYTLATIRKIREEFGSASETGLGEENVGKLLLYGLQHEDPDLTLTDVEAMVDMQNLEACMKAVAEAMGNQGKLQAEARALVSEAPPSPAADPETKT